MRLLYIRCLLIVVYHHSSLKWVYECLFQLFVWYECEVVVVLDILILLFEFIFNLYSPNCYKSYVVSEVESFDFSNSN